MATQISNNSPAALGVSESLSGQPWQWRGNQADYRDGLQPDDLMTQLLLTRGVERHDLARHKSPTLRDFMPDPSLFQDMDKAAARLADAVEAQEQVTIFGDYDVDGATSAALLIRLLGALGLEAGSYIPDRLMEGYGPSGEALVKLKQAGSSLVVTVDCGAMAFEALDMAAKAELDVVVVDHHKCAAELPRAFAMVNPNRQDENDEAASFGHLAAVGVAFLLGAALIRELRGRDYFAEREVPDLMQLLDLVALGTVADVAQLHGLNRAFVTQGLKIMARRRNTGLESLIQASRLTRDPVCSDLGFALGPRINAGGRVGQSDLGVNLLTTSDRIKADDIARQLDQLNEERRAIEASVQEMAEEKLAAEEGRAVAIVSAKSWHPGVIGIVAGRLKERLGRPAIVIAVDDDGIGKGSGRSISGVDLGAAIIAAREAGIVQAGGGHAMAAGITIAEDQIDNLRAFLDEQLQQRVETARRGRALLLDVVVSAGGLTPDFVTTLEGAGPYGVGWPGPRVVIGPVRMIKVDIVGTNHVRMIVSGDDGKSIKAIAFRSADTNLGQSLLSAPRDTKFWLAGRAKIDDWGGRNTAELIVDDAAIAS
jgi:single-stranded-DNA-specific exonuclease